MLNWIKKHWILSIFLLVGGVPASLNYSGYCWEQKRWLSDEEFLVNALMFESRSKKTLISYSDESARKFIKENPECYRFGRGGFGSVDMFSKIFGLAYVYIEVEYKLAENWRDGSLDYGEGKLWLNSCGGVVKVTGTAFEKKYSCFNKNK
mgnify:CR=1 FL=1